MKVKLIVLIDFSPFSETLVHLASSWATALTAELLLVHEIPGLVPAMADSGMKAQILEMEKTDSLANLKNLREQYISEEVPVTYSITEQTLVHYVSGLKTDGYRNLVMLGLKGTGFLKNFFIGSTATKVITELEEIIVAVPLNVNPVVPEVLTIALNYKFPLNQKALDWLLLLLGANLKEIDFLSVVTPKDDQEEVEGYLKELNQQYQQRISCTFKIFTGTDFFREIKAYLAENGKNMLVVQKGSRSLTDRMFRRFFIDDIVNDGSIPLIILPT